MSGVLIATYIFGMYSYKNENIRDRVMSVRKLTNFSYKKYRLGAASNPKQVNLIIPDSSMAVLKNCRAEAIADNILRDKNKKEVPAQLVYNGDTLKIKMRLKGDYSDHWAGEKWSYRIYVKEEKGLFGMKSFSVQAPETRKNLNEWYFHKLMAAEGLIALRYDFISLSENGKEKGLYAIEESFDKDLIEFNERREAPILKFDESILIDKSIINDTENFSLEQLFLMTKIEVFKSKRTLKNPVLYNQFLKAKEILDGFRTGILTASQAFDVDKAAKLFAIADVVGGHHALRWKNVRFYFNPVLNKLELIGFDSNSGNTITDIYFMKWRDNHIGKYDVGKWKDRFFEDHYFVSAYFRYLEKYGDPKFLEEFHKSIEEELNTALSYFYKDNSRFIFYIEYYYENCKIIKNRVEAYKNSLKLVDRNYFLTVKANAPFVLNDTRVDLTIRNTALSPIEVLGLFNPEEEKISVESPFVINSRDIGEPYNLKDVVLTLRVPVDSNQLKLKRNKNRWVHKKVKLAYRFSDHPDTFYTRVEHNYNIEVASKSQVTLSSDCFEIDHNSKTVIARSGKWTMNQNVILPKGYALKCGPGTTFVLNNHAVLVINGQMEFKGTESNPIVIDSEDSTGTVLVYQSANKSHLEYVEFNRLNGALVGSWGASGGVNFYEADLSLHHVNFRNNLAEDALNIFRSDFEMSDVAFYNTKSDAFDSDFSTGTITSTLFNNIGNDALDFSGSEITIRQIIASNIGDKGISAGENSQINCENIKIDSCELGLVSKDLSLLTATDVKMKSVAVPYVVFQKKGVYGPARLKLDEFSSSGYQEPFLLEFGSEAIVDGDTIKPVHQHVADMLYGELFGKRSK